ncbi:GAF domain-containing protein [Streptomyces sp. NRRL F-5650]|uniref:GAF domain-containing protein n=1 Tax=Streptomyces sp. NRRL F-5650 TaxID=1463868 RepID=UPI0004C76FEB
MGDVVEEGTAERGSRVLRAEGALKAVAATPVPGDRQRRFLEQALVFAGASLAALYMPGDDRELLCLAEAVGVPRTLYGVRDSYPAAGGSPVADARRAGEPVWIGPEEFAGSAESRHVPSSGFSLAVLPVSGDGGGCLFALTEHPGGFDAEDRACLEAIAEAMTCPAPAGTPPTAEQGRAAHVCAGRRGRRHHPHSATGPGVEHRPGRGLNEPQGGGTAQRAGSVPARSVSGAARGGRRAHR